jgi:long-chain acyl-CoA synthetase
VHVSDIHNWLQSDEPRGDNMNESGYRNLLEMVANTVSRCGQATALRDPLPDKRYREWTYHEFWQGVRKVANALQELGVSEGHRVALISENHVWWPIADLAIMSLGAWTVPVYPNIPPVQVEYILKHAGVKGVIVQDEVQLKKVLSAAPVARESIGFVTVCEGAVAPQTLEMVRDNAYTYERFFDWLERESTWSEAAFEALWSGLERHHPASIIYTSGTTGTPKGAVLTHGNLLANVEGILPIVPIYASDESISYLPLSHIFERTASQWITFYTGGCITYSRGIDAIVDEFQVVRPTVFTTVPRLLEKVHEGVWHKMAAESGFRRRLFERALTLGEQARVQGQPVNRMSLWFHDVLVCSKIRKLFGGRLRLIVSGGAPLPPHVFRFLTAMGITVVEGYGLTETSPVIAVNSSKAPRMGVVGQVLANVEARIESDGELVVRGESISPGYYQNIEATEKAFVDGWFHTGDIAEFTDDGYLKITDRKKNLLILSTGKNVAPAPIESEILASPLIDQVLLIGHGRKFVSAIVVPSSAAIGRVRSDAEHSNAVLEGMLMEVVKQQSASFAGFEQPKKVLICYEPFTIENGLLTPTLKIRASLVLEKYQREIDELYATAEKPHTGAS